MRLTHSLCTNWDISTGVDVDDERHRVLIGQVSHRLDGDQLWGVSLWRLPEENPEKGLSVGWPQEYLQAAGAGDRMAMDIRVLDQDDDGACLQYAVGRPVAVAQADTAVEWQGNSVAVYENEVMSAPDGYELRCLEEPVTLNYDQLYEMASDDQGQPTMTTSMTWCTRCIGPSQEQAPSARPWCWARLRDTRRSGATASSS